MSRLLSAFDRMLSKSVVGTLLVLFGGVVVVTGLLYSLALGVPELLAVSSSGLQPAGNSRPIVFAALVVLSGAAVVTLGGQLVGYVR
jgi:hypothetical protein